MALIDDLLEGGNVVAGLAIGVTALVVWPLMRPLALPLAKTAIKGVIVTYREAKRLSDDTMRGVGNLVKEALEEVGPDPAQEVAKEVGTDLAKEAVAEVGADLAKEAI